MNIEEFEKIRAVEGDYFEFFSYNLKCYMRRTDMLHLCGYIEIPKLHGFYKKYTDDSEVIYSLIVHGGVTWDDIDEDRLCIGFDCNHSCDMRPGLLYHSIPFPTFTGSTYKDKEYVIKELRELAGQIYRIAPLYYDIMVKVLKKINQ
jgi:hypothetical protein